MRLMGNLRAPIVCSFCLLSVACSASSDGDSPTLDTGAGGAGGSGDVKASGGATGLGGTSSAGGSVSGAAGKASNAGSADAGSGSGGSNAAGGAGSGGSSGSGNEGGVTGAACSDPTAPVLVPGVWKDISPPAFAEIAGQNPFMQGVALDPNNSCVLYVCIQSFSVGSGTGLYKTTDAGSTWKKIGPLDEPMHVRIDPEDSQHLYAVDGVRGGTMGFWISKDGGATWSVPSSWGALGKDFYYGDLYDIAVEPGDFNHILVTSHSWWGDKYPSGSGVLESRDGGASWTIHPPTGAWGSGHSIWFLGDSSTWLLGTQDAGFWRTSDSGASWTQVVKDEGIMHGGGQIYRVKDGMLYASGGWRLLRSPDNGVTWEKIGDEKSTTAIYGDGKRLYTHQAWGGPKAPFVTTLESDGLTWAPYEGGTQTFENGPYEMTFEPHARIMYSGNWANGLLALKVKD